MTNLRDLFRDPKEREDVIISLVVLLLFLGPMLYFLFGRSAKTAQDTLPIAEQNDLSGEASAATVAVSTTLESSASSYNDDLDEDDFIEETTDDPQLNNYLNSLSTNNTSSTRTKGAAIAPTIKKGNEKIEELKEKLPPAIEEEEGEEFEPKVAPKAKTEVEAPVSKEEETTAKETEEKETISNPLNTKEEEKTIETPSKEEVVKSTQPKTNSTKKATTPKAAPKPAAKNKYDCFVVLGAFKELENSKSMIQKIKQRNYPVYQGRQQGKFIVGVNCTCSESKTLLPQLRRDLEPEAFLVKRD